jgi:hypothetical protein
VSDVRQPPWLLPPLLPLVSQRGSAEPCPWPLWSVAAWSQTGGAGTGVAVDVAAAAGRALGAAVAVAAAPTTGTLAVAAGAAFAAAAFWALSAR